MALRDARTFRLVRHGETDWNKTRIYQGQNDIPLNETGVEQARALAAKLSSEKLTEIYTSPLLRARRTAEILREAMPGEVELIEVADLMECSSVECARFVIELEGTRPLPDFGRLRGTESIEDFLARVERGLEFVLGRARDENPLIVAHGGVCMATCRLLGVPTFRYPNCAVVEFVRIGAGFTARIT